MSEATHVCPYSLVFFSQKHRVHFVWVMSSHWSPQTTILRLYGKKKSMCLYLNRVECSFSPKDDYACWEEPDLKNNSLIFCQHSDPHRSIWSHQKTFLKVQESPHLELQLMTKASQRVVLLPLPLLVIMGLSVICRLIVRSLATALRVRGPGKL